MTLRTDRLGEAAREIAQLIATCCRQIATVAIALFAVTLMNAVGAQTTSPATCGFILNADGSASTAAIPPDGGLTGTGLLFTRYALGLSGADLIRGTHIDQTPANQTAVLAAINAHMGSFSAAHDIDGSGPPIDVNDAVIIARHLAGFRGEALTAGLNLTGSRKTAAEVETYIANGCPTASGTLPLSCSLFGPAVIPLSSAGAFSVTCTSNDTPVTGLTYGWTPGANLSIANGCDAQSSSCTVNGIAEGNTTISVSATKSGYAAGTASLATRVSGNVLTITALTPKDVILPPTQTRPAISASYSNSNPSVSVVTSSVRLFVDGVDVTTSATVTASSISYTPAASIDTGPHTIYLTVDNTESVTAQAIWGFELDTLATYDISITAPAADGTTVRTPTTDVSVTTAANKTYANNVTLSSVTSSGTRSVDAQLRYVTVGTPPNTASNPVWMTPIVLKPGLNTITATATFADGQTRTETRTITYDAPPAVVFTSPNDFATFGAINPTSPTNLSGNVERPVTLKGVVSKPLAQITGVSINQQSAALSADPTNANATRFQFDNFFLREGTNLVTATATDASGQIGSASLTLYVDQTAPIITIEAPVNTAQAGLVMPVGKSSYPVSSSTPQAITSNNKVDVRGIVNDAVEGGLQTPYPTVTVLNVTNGQTITGKVSDRFYIAEDVPLEVGQNELTVTATDWVGNARSQHLIVSRVNVGSNRITLAGGNRQRGPLNTELTKPLVVTAFDKTGLPLANVALTFEVLRGTGSINPAVSGSVTTTTGSGANSITTTIPSALTGSGQPAVKPDGVNPARRLVIATDANGRAAVWFTLGKQSGEAGNMVQVSASDANAINATTAANPSNTSPRTVDISEAVVFTATAERGLPAKILAEGGGAQYAETGGQPLDPLTNLTYDGDNNPVPGAVVAYVIEQDGGVDLDDGAKFGNGSASNALAISSNRKVLITSADNNGRSAARPTMGVNTSTVKVSAYALPPNTTVRPELIEGFQNGTIFSDAAYQVAGLATYQIAVLQQSDGPTQFSGKVLDHTGKALAGVKLTISRTPLTVTSDANGDFLFTQDVPPGKLDLFVDGRAVTGTTPMPTTNGNTQSSTPTQYPSLHFEVLAIKGQKNILPHPIYLPPLLMSQAKIVGGNQDVSITMPGFEGFEMIVKANSVTFPDGSREGPLVVSPVHADRLPMVPPGGGATFTAPGWTIQPSGTRFDPPVEIRIPNTGARKPGETTELYQWDHDLATFLPMGRMTVSDDGSQLITDAGSGIVKAGWSGNTPPPPPPPDCGTGVAPTCDDCSKAETTSFNGCQQTTCKQKTQAELEGALSISIPAAASTVPVVPDSEQPNSTLMQIQTSGLPTAKKSWSVTVKSTSPYNVGQSSRGGGPLTCQASCKSSDEMSGNSYLIQRQHCMLSEISGELITGAAKATVKACSGSCETNQDFQVRMQNPSPDVIVAFINSTQSDPALRNAIRGLACHEAGAIGGRRFNHFRSDGFPVPNGSGDGGFGIMQVTDVNRASCKALWDWRENIRAGTDIFAREKIGSARTKIRSEGTIASGTFSNPQLLACLQRSGQRWAGLLAAGSIPALTEEQVVREAIRGFNGGREYKWVLTNAGEATDCSRGSWQISPRTTQNPNYVNDVLQCQ